MSLFYLFSRGKELAAGRKRNTGYSMTMTKGQLLGTFKGGSASMHYKWRTCEAKKTKVKLLCPMKPELMFWMTREEPRGKIRWLLN